MAVTIDDVAKKAGVASSTVSRVFNNKGRISEETRQRVLEVAKDLNYQPRKYEKKKQVILNNNIFIIYNKKTQVENNIFYNEVMEGLEQILSENQYNLLFKTISGEKEKDQQIIDFILNSDDKAGIIFLGFLGYEMDNDIIVSIKEKGIPLILIDNILLEQDVDCVVTDNYYGAIKGVNYLIELGHKEIAFIGGPLSHVSLNERYMGYKTALKRAGFEKKDHLVKICDPDFLVEEGYQATLEIFNNDEKNPSAIFAANDDLATGVLKAANETGIIVPGQLSVLGFDDVYFSRHTTPPLSTIKVFKRQMGREAAKRLLELINGISTKPMKDIVTTELVVRGSTGKPPISLD
ncbi:LacI family DNA-binding transcriptional regulator [Natronospora cellulosivora (SeqCode)]